MWGDLSVVGGYGIAHLKNTGNTGMLDGGAMIRFFGTGHLIYKLDIRQFVFFSSAVKPNMAISFALGYNFGGADPNKLTATEGEE